jgi:hypothetical protein
MTRKRFMLLLIICSAFFALRPLSGQINPSPALAPPSKHTFDLTIHYHYSVADYLTPHSLEDLLRDPLTAGHPERALAELVLAARENKYDTWLSKWDALSQQHITENLSTNAMTKDQYLAAYSQKLKGAQLVKVASRPPYVFFILHGGPNGDIALAFKSSEKGWLATTEVDWEAQQLAGPNL